MVVKNLLRVGLGTALMIGSAGQLCARQEPQPPKQPPAEQAPKQQAPQRDLDTQQYFRKPETAPEFWRIMKHEIELGQFALADQYLKGFLAKNPTDEELLQIHAKEGSSGFLRLLTIPETAADAKPLVERVGQLVQKFVTDPNRLQKLIKDLVDGADDPREVAFAINEMRKAGPAAVPALVNALIVTAERPREHLLILDALEKLDHNTTLPLAAALEISNPNIRAELINVFRKRGEFAAVPFLWFYAADPNQLPIVRSRAQEALVALAGKAGQPLPHAKEALTREAEKYYKHQVNLGTAGAPVTYWKWDGRQLVSQPVTVSQAEELYGLHFAGQALKLDPGFEPAQIAFLSLALDKAIERSGISEPLAKAGQVKELLTSVNPTLVIAVLRKALAEHRVPVILGATRALGELAEPRAVEASRGEVPVLAQALSYPDRRVQMAAADAILKMARPGGVATSRVLKVLRRNANVDARPQVLVVDPNQDRGAAIAEAIKKAGYEVIISNNGTAALQRLASAADIDAVVLDAEVTNPQLPYLLPQLRSDIDAGRMPIILLGKPQQVPQLESRFGSIPGLVVTAETTNPATFKTLLERLIKVESGTPITEAERKDFAALAMLWLARIARGEVQGYDIGPVQSALLQGLSSNDLAPLAIEAVGNLSNPEAQRQLARLVLDNMRPAPLRTAAANSLTKSIQHFGNHLLVEQVGALQALYESAPDAKLKSAAAVVVGALHPNANQTGQRLQRYVPTFGTAPAPKPAAPAEPKTDAPTDKQ